MEKQIYRCGLNDHYKRNAEHKLDVLGFVADDQHCDEHRDTAAECREQKQRFFGRAELNSVLLGDLFVVNADNYRNQRNYRDIYDKYR